MTLTQPRDIVKKYHSVFILDFAVMGELTNSDQNNAGCEAMASQITPQAEIEIYQTFCLDRCINVCRTSGSDFPCLKRLIASGSKNVE